MIALNGGMDFPYWYVVVNLIQCEANPLRSTPIRDKEEGTLTLNALRDNCIFFRREKMKYAYYQYSKRFFLTFLHYYDFYPPTARRRSSSHLPFIANIHLSFTPLLSDRVLYFYPVISQPPFLRLYLVPII